MQFWLSCLTSSKTIAVWTVLIVLGAAMSVAQKTEFVPKSKKEVEREIQAEQQEQKRIASSGIRAITRTKYPYKFGKVSSEGITESLTRYNSKGQKTKVTTYDPSDGKISSITSYQYDKQGNLIEELLKKDEQTLKTSHRYDARNNRIETVYYTADGKVEKKITNIYDQSGLLLETYGRLEDGKMFMRDTYLYDGKGNVVEFRNSLRKFEITYDRKGNILTVFKYNRYFQSYDSVHYVLNEWFGFEYDGNGNLVELKAFRPDSTLKTRSQYVVQTNGKLLAEKQFSADGRLIYNKTFLYDKDQNLVEVSGNDRLMKFKELYKYDSKGNTVQWITYNQVNEPQSLMKFTFSKYGGSPSKESGSSAPDDDPMLADDEEQASNDEFFQLLNARIIAPDGTYLGMVLADTANPQSIINSWGQYGFSQSPTSIFNPAIPYGGTSGLFSPFNSQSPSPPSLFKDGKFYTYLTDNDSFRPRSSPRQLIEFLKVLAKQN